MSPVTLRIGSLTCAFLGLCIGVFALCTDASAQSTGSQSRCKDCVCINPPPSNKCQTTQQKDCPGNCPLCESGNTDCPQHM
jgi:hypothetical protein